MSGTSADGIDAALVSVQGRGEALRVRLLRFITTAYPPAVRTKILQVCHDGSSALLCRLNFELGELFAQACQDLCRRARKSLSEISFIGSHGQTVAHLGRQGTLQIAESSVIAERTGVTTVADFRTRDVAAGGEGAPLTPYFNYLLFRHPRLHVAVHNLGGISNLTLIPRGVSLSDIHGFDTGPGNMVIDGLVHCLTHGALNFDPDGRMAARGMISLPLLHRLLQHPFFKKRPPKTAGREQFGASYLKNFIRMARRYRLSESDMLATATALTASTVAQHYRKFVFPRAVPDEIVFGGGGIKNRTLMRMIRQELTGHKMLTCDERGIPSDAAEAVCFAVLAYQTLHGRSSNLPSVTGAGHPVLLGKIIPGKGARPFLR